ncbi:MAG TPA: hypothetical protein VFU98_09115, partial [Microlunatus sp.]|nr:hypothetical protein [Microlunatus sp.]
MSDPAGEERRTGDEAPPEVIARRIGEPLVAELGDEISGIVGHGSWVHGDFCPGRSDLDLVVVLKHDPGPPLLAVAGPVLDDVTREAPVWRNRLEIGFTSREAVEAVLAGSDGHVVGRISPGEPLHLVPADRHRLLDWDAAHRGRAIYGPSAAEILPAIPA